MFLSHEDLQKLTGKSRYSAQIAWLQDHGYRHTVNDLGQPVVHEGEVERHLVGGPMKKKNDEPNWDALNGPQKAA